MFYAHEASFQDGHDAGQEPRISSQAVMIRPVGTVRNG